jgi:phosphatidylethanolamine-binding protein (PEBP) family uncharacterized protein
VPWLVRASAVLLMAVACGPDQSSYSIQKLGPQTMVLTSPSFKHGERIPERHAALGGRQSPPLEWKNAPPGTKSFLLYCRDLDVRSSSWTVWFRYNIPAATDHLVEGAGNHDPFPDGTVQPCYYMGVGAREGETDRFEFTLYALNTLLGPGLTAIEPLSVDAYVTGHVLAKAQLIGTYTYNFHGGPPIF